MRKLTQIFLLLVLGGLSSSLYAQCSMDIALGASSTSGVFDNRKAKCSTWRFAFTSTASTTVSVETASSLGGVPSTWSTFAGTSAVTGTSGTITGTGTPDFVRVKRTPGLGTVTGFLFGTVFDPGTGGGGGGSPTGAAGGALSGTYPNPTIAAVTNPSWLTLTTAAITSGTFANARISQASVTQHQAALSIAWGQLTSVPLTFAPSAHNHAASEVTSGTFLDARIAQTNVTQHQAALSIGWGQLTSVPSTFTPSTHSHAATDVTSGTFANARISQASVTQYQGNLSIGWSQLTSVPSTFAPFTHDHSGAGAGGQLTPSAFAAGNKTGIGTKVATSTSTAYTSQCATWDANGDLIGTGAVCGAGGGGDNLGTATANNIGAVLYAADTSVSANTITATLSPAIASYAAGACYNIKVANSNTGATVANLNGIGSINVTKVAGGVASALAANDLRAGQIATFCSDGTNLQLQSTLGNSPAGSGTVTNAATLTANAIVLGNGGAAVTPLGSLGTTSQVLIGNASGAPTWGSITNGMIANSTIDVTQKITGIVPMNNGGTGVNAAPDNAILVGGTSQWLAKVLPDCGTTSSKLLYDASTKTFTCGTDQTTGSLEIQVGGSVIATRNKINFTATPTVTVACADDAPNSRANCNFTMNAGVSGSSVLKGDGAGGITAATAGTDFIAPIVTSALIKGNNAGGLAAAVSGTDYLAPFVTSSIIKGNGSGGLAAAVAATDFIAPVVTSSLVKGNGAGALVAAVAGTDFAPATSGSSVLKANGSGGFSAAVAGTDFAAPPAGAVLLKSDGAGGFAAATASDLPTAARTRVIGVTMDGAGSAITTGTKGYIRVPFACTISKVSLLADQSGSMVVDIYKDTYANYPPNNLDTITASAKPTLSSASKYEDSTLTGWTKNVASGDVIGFNVDSASTVTRAHVLVECQI